MDANDYYRTHAQEFFDNTVNIDMDAVRKRWIAYLPEHATTILDMGCGSGRDALAFSKLGYCVTAFDASLEMAELASAHTGLNVRVSTIEDWTARSQLTFDGIWACASLLHLRQKSLAKVIGVGIWNLLKPNGTTYISFKFGGSTRTDSHGRIFTDMDIPTLMQLVKPFLVRDLWQSVDVRADRRDMWLNAILTKSA